MRAVFGFVAGVVPLLIVAAGCSSDKGGASPASSSAASAASISALFAAIPRHPHKAVCSDRGPGHARCLSRIRVDASGKPEVTATPTSYGPPDIQSAYAIPAGGGAGTIVGIVDAYDDPTAESDLAVYRAHYGLPACTTANGCFQKVNQSGVAGSYPGQDAQSEWPVETSLDLDAVSSACPSCKILLVETTSDNLSDLGAGVNTAVTLGAATVSNSYGGSEDSTNAASSVDYYDHPGILVTASTGDDGYGVEYPASSQYVLGVGGTSLLATSTVARGWAETAWTSGGSGCSAYTPKPSWQKDTGCAKKTVADISADADPETGLSVYDTTAGETGWIVIGGTSEASPLVASIFAATGRTAAGPSFPYANPTWMNDVTSGSNGSCGGTYLCTAGVGYDGPTGMGTPNAALWTSGGTSGVDAGSPTTGGAAPTVTLVSPANGAQLAANAQVKIVADVSSSVGLADVTLEWTQSTGTVAVDCASPPSNTTCTNANGAYTWSFTGSTGSRSWSVVAKDTAGQTTTSATRTLTLVATTTAPVTITSPAAGTEYVAGESVTFEAQTATSGVSQVWLTWVAPSGASSQLEMSSLGSGSWDVSVPVTSSMVAGTRKLTATAYGTTNAVLGTAQTTIQVE
jgi:subtilase family serine protease